MQLQRESRVTTGIDEDGLCVASREMWINNAMQCNGHGTPALFSSMTMGHSQVGCTRVFHIFETKMSLASKNLNLKKCNKEETKQASWLARTRDGRTRSVLLAQPSASH